MPLALAPAIAIAAGAAGSVASGVIGANAAGNAAQSQESAAKYAADLQKQQADQALAFQEKVYNQGQANQAPFLSAGQGAVTNLASLLGVLGPQGQQTGNLTAPTGNIPVPQGVTDGQVVRDPSTGAMYQASGGTLRYLPDKNAVDATGVPYNKVVQLNQAQSVNLPPPGQGSPSTANTAVNPSLGAPGSLLQGWTGQFNAPTAAEAAATPGYQFQLQQGQQALERSAAARGSVLGSGTLKALDQYSQGLADTSYNDTFNRALTQYQTAYNTFQNNQTNTYNRLANLSGLGQISANNLNASGNQAAGNVGNILLGSGQQIGNDIQNAGAARASGYINQANAYGAAIQGLGKTLGGYSLLDSLLKGQGTAGNTDPGVGGGY